MVTPVSVDARPTAWQEAGSGDLALFLHGIGGSRIAWDRQLTALAGMRRCVAWDMPGYGASSGSPSSFPVLADAAAALIEAVTADHPNAPKNRHIHATADVVGLSMGGMVAQYLTLEHAHRVRSLVLIDTSPAFGMDGTTPEEWLAQRMAPLADGLTPADLAERIVGAIMGPNATAEQRDEGIAAMSRISPGALAASCRTLITHDTRDRLGEIDCPTLILVGELDDETPLAYAQTLADGIRDARLEVIPGAGHLTPTEAPEAVNALIREFWSTLPTPAGAGRNETEESL